MAKPYALVNQKLCCIRFYKTRKKRQRMLLRMVGEYGTWSWIHALPKRSFHSCCKFHRPRCCALRRQLLFYILLKICLWSLFNDLMLKTNRLKKDFFYKDSLIFGLDDPVANMSIRHVYYAWGAREKTYPLKRVSFCLVSSSALVHLANFQLSYHKF